MGVGSDLGDSSGQPGAASIPVRERNLLQSDLLRHGLQVVAEIHAPKAREFQDVDIDRGKT